MDTTLLAKKQERVMRKRRIRALVQGEASCPRFTVYKSNSALTAQLIDDQKGHTLVSAKVATANMTSAAELGKKVAELALAKKIKACVFDRNGYRFHGVVKAIADSAREGGLQF